MLVTKASVAPPAGANLNKLAFSETVAIINQCLKKFNLERNQLTYQQRTALGLLMISRDFLEIIDSSGKVIDNQEWFALIEDAECTFKRAKKNNYYNANRAASKKN